MGVMARRVKGQWNENAKNWSAFDVMSELNHNAVVGFPNPPIARVVANFAFNISRPPAQPERGALQAKIESTRTSAATCTSLFSSSEAVPTQCSTPWPLSLQTNSIISVSAANSAWRATVHGLA